MLLAQTMNPAALTMNPALMQVLAQQQ